MRHTEVALSWKSRCYGCHDVGLSRAGLRQAHDLATRLAQEPIAAVVSSSLRRARLLADRIGLLKGLPVQVDDRWRERDFGTWEGRSWHSIWRESGNAMDGMLSNPHDFRPGGGETTADLAARALSAFNSLPHDGLTVVISHGGPIAAVRAFLAGAQFPDIAQFVIPTGAFVRHS